MTSLILSLLPLTKSFKLYNKLHMKMTSEINLVQETGTFLRNRISYTSLNYHFYSELQNVIEEWSVYCVYFNLDNYTSNYILKSILMLFYFNYHKGYKYIVYPILKSLVGVKHYNSLLIYIEKMSEKIRYSTMSK